MNDSYINHKERSPKMWLGFIIHCSWVYALISYCDHKLLTYFVASLWQGTLALQLISNHYWKPFIEQDEAKKVSFPMRQIEVNVNIKCSRWMDWFYGGLHFHNEHHAFPCMPRYNLRLCSADMKDFCAKYGAPYEYLWFSQILWNMCVSL
jgi:fatty acid desaturase